MAASSTPLRAASPDGQLELAADQARITLVAGTQQRLALSLQNKAGSPLSVQVGAKGLPGNWLSLSLTSLQLAPVQGAAVALTLSPPSEAPAGDYPLTVLAQVTDHPEAAVRLNLTLEIAERGKLTVAVAPPQAEGQASAEFQVQLAQTGGDTLALSLSAKDEEDACEYTFEPANLVLQPSGSANSRLVVRGRQGLGGLDSRTFVFNVTATATQGAAVMGTAQGRFIQRRALPLQLTLVPAEQRGPDRVEYAVRLANQSQVQTTVRLSARDSEGACRFEFNPASLTLPPSGQAQAALGVAPLQYQSGTAEKVHAFTVRAEPTGELLTPVEIEGRFTQTPAGPLLLTLRPPAQSKSGPATYTVQVKNPRGAPLDVELSAYDVNGGCTFNVTPARLRIPPNGTATAQLSVRPTADLLPGEARRTYPFTVEARAADMPEPATVQGLLTLVRPSRLGLFLVGAAIALLLGLCLAAVLVARSILGSQVTITPTVIAAATILPTHTVVVVAPSVTPQVVLKETALPADTVAPTTAPPPPVAPSPFPSLSPAPPTAKPLPTHTPLPPHASSTPKPAVAPGVYVTALRVVRVGPPPSQPNVFSMVFFATFLNATDAPQGYIYRVEVFKPDNLNNSLGITSSVNVSVPVGVSELQSGPYNVNACLTLRARVIHEGDHKKRIPFVKPDGSDFWFDFVVCS